MDIYRIEHIESRLGPYQHNNCEQRVIQHGFFGKTNLEGTIVMCDIDSENTVKELLSKYPHGVLKFGFNSLPKAQAIVKDYAVIKQHGFDLFLYRAEGLYVSTCGQVLFLAPFNRKLLDFTTGEQK